MDRRTMDSVSYYSGSYTIMIRDTRKQSTRMLLCMYLVCITRLHVLDTFDNVAVLLLFVSYRINVVPRREHGEREA